MELETSVFGESSQLQYSVALDDGHPSPWTPPTPYQYPLGCAGYYSLGDGLGLKEWDRLELISAPLQPALQLSSA